ALGERIAAAHADTAAVLPGRPTLQLGMDTPQADAALLAACLDRLRAPRPDAVPGLAAAGGGWAPGVRGPRASRAGSPVTTPRARHGRRARARRGRRLVGPGVARPARGPARRPGADLARRHGGAHPARPAGRRAAGRPARGADRRRHRRRRPPGGRGGAGRPVRRRARPRPDVRGGAVTAAFDAALRGTPARMLRSDGAEVVLAVGRWHADAAGDDAWLL